MFDDGAVDEIDIIFSWGLLYLGKYKYKKYSGRLNVKQQLNLVLFSEYLSIWVSFNVHKLLLQWINF